MSALGRLALSIPVALALTGGPGDALADGPLDPAQVVSGVQQTVDQATTAPQAGQQQPDATAPAAERQVAPVPEKPTAPVAEASASVERTVTETAAPVERTVTETAAPVARTVTEAAAPVARTVTEAAASVERTVTEAAASVERTVTEAAASVERTVTEAAASVERTVTETAAPVVQVVAETAAPAVQAVTQVASPVMEVAITTSGPADGGVSRADSPEGSTFVSGSVTTPSAVTSLDATGATRTTGLNMTSAAMGHNTLPVGTTPVGVEDTAGSTAEAVRPYAPIAAAGAADALRPSVPFTAGFEFREFAVSLQTSLQTAGPSNGLAPHFGSSLTATSAGGTAPPIRQVGRQLPRLLPTSGQPDTPNISPVGSAFGAAVAALLLFLFLVIGGPGRWFRPGSRPLRLPPFLSPLERPG
jgi:hypothetical protein